MVPRVGKPSTAARVAIVCAVLALLAGCGSAVRGGLSARASATPSTQDVSGGCSSTVLGALGDVAMRAYREGVASERTRSAMVFIERSIPLRNAVEHDDPQAARAAALALLATGHMTDLKVLRGGTATGGGGQVLADVGAPEALAPLHGSIAGASGAPIGTFVASVWADTGYVQEASGIAEGIAALRQNGRSLAGSFALGASEPPPQGSMTIKGTDYAYTSFPAAAYPTGQLRVYLLKSLPAIAPLCGKTAQDTLVNTLSRVARLIYTSEGGTHALVQVRRVQDYQPLLRAVAARDPIATRLSVEHLLHEHVVRLRVSAGGHLLSDDGGPYVLAPVHAPLRLHGRTIGNIELSIQDDEGYKRLAGRLAGLDVLMYMGSQLVKNSLGPAPGKVPASGTYHYRGHTFRVYTLHARAFPSGPLRIVVLIPIPYS
ncbi:MAG TPA: hypothetical protein VGI24_12115 [Solirubrobacteraceae bacterium]|jgi:hypothetical protein